MVLANLLQRWLPIHWDPETSLPYPGIHHWHQWVPHSGVEILSADGPGEKTEGHEMSSIKLAWPSAKKIAYGTGGQQLSYLNHTVLPTKAQVRLKTLRACRGRRQDILKRRWFSTKEGRDGLGGIPDGRRWSLEGHLHFFHLSVVPTLSSVSCHSVVGPDFVYTC